MRRLLRCLAVSATLFAAGCARAPVPDLVVTNARVFTNDAARPWAEAVAIRGDRVVALGDSAAIRASARPSTLVIDAGGRVLIPGMNDARVDLPVDEPPTPASLSALDRDAIARGVTSLQVVSGGPMRTLVEAARLATRRARWRLIRSPMDGERPKDESPFLPPQPGVGLEANGVAWALTEWAGRAPLAPARLDTVVRWAYGAEDPLVVALRGDRSEGGVGEVSGRAELGAFLAAVRRAGMADVWKRKRPRLDVFGRIPIDPGAGRRGFPPVLDVLLDELRGLGELGIVVTAVPRPMAERRYMKDTDDFSEPVWFRETGVVVAVGSGSGRSLPSALADFLQYDAPAIDVMIHAATRGGAYAEQAERDKGWLGRGTLADFAVMSTDVFTITPDELRKAASVLTVVGGAVVYDAGVLPR